MLRIGKKETIILYSDAVDMRNRFDGLVRIIREKMHCDPENGYIYVFLNKRRNTISILRCMRDRIILYAERLEPGGVYDRPLGGGENGITQIDESVLMFIIRGALGPVQFRKRYAHPGPICA